MTKLCACYPALAAAVVAMGCPKTKPSVGLDGAEPRPASTEATPRAIRLDAQRESPLTAVGRDQIGKCLVVFGYAQDSKSFSKVVGPDFEIGVVLPEGRWPAALAGAPVRVQGIVAERSDLPVFVPRPGEPIVQGIPVSPGTDLDKARRRLVLEKAVASRLRETRQTETDLGRAQGRPVEILGVLWSLNNHWWFDHNGTQIHVDAITKVPNFTSSLHGRPIMLKGKLERKRLPRLDQIALKASPDIAEAFIVTGASVAPHAIWSPKPCEPRQERPLQFDGIFFRER